MNLAINLLLAAGRDDEAKPYIARLPEGEKLDATTRLNMGIELYNQNDYDAALVEFDQAITDYPDQPDGYYYRGLIYLGQQNNAEATADLEKFLELGPDAEKAEEAQQFLEYLKGQK